MRHLTVVGLLAWVTCSLAIAKPPAPATWDFALDKKTKCSTGTMLDMGSCRAREYAKSDARLNVVYKHLGEALLQPAALQRAQLAWIRFRDMQCAFEVPPEWSGSGVDYSRNACLIDHTERRIRDLEQVHPCNGCVEFKDQYYNFETRYQLPP